MGSQVCLFFKCFSIFFLVLINCTQSSYTFNLYIQPYHLYRPSRYAGTFLGPFKVFHMEILFFFCPSAIVEYHRTMTKIFSSTGIRPSAIHGSLSLVIWFHKTLSLTVLAFVQVSLPFPVFRREVHERKKTGLRRVFLYLDVLRRGNFSSGRWCRRF